MKSLGKLLRELRAACIGMIEYIDTRIDPETGIFRTNPDIREIQDRAKWFYRAVGDIKRSLMNELYY